jgi:hypothetical protein
MCRCNDAAYSMIRKSGYRFSEKIVLKQKLKRNGDPTLNHFALADGNYRPK